MTRLATTILLAFLVCLSCENANAEWRRQESNTLAWLKSVHFSDAKNGWIGGSKGALLRTRDAGAKWTKQVGVTRDTIRQVLFSDKNNGWLLCERDIYNLGSAGASYLMKTSDAGETWVKVDLNNPQRQRLTRIFFAKNGFGLAIGETGVLFGLQDDDRTWGKLSLPVSYLMSDGVFLDDFRGAVVGGGGTILFTEDAGVSWNQAFVAGKSPSKFNAVFFNDKQTGWAVGSKGEIFQTLNGGRAWRSQRSNTSERLNDVFFLNSAEGWAIGDNGSMLHTTTAGNIWRKTGTKSTHRLESIFFNGTKGWVVGFGGTILKYDAGSATKFGKPGFSKHR